MEGGILTALNFFCFGGEGGLICTPPPMARFPLPLSKKPYISLYDLFFIPRKPSRRCSIDPAPSKVKGVFRPLLGRLGNLLLNGGRLGGFV